MDGRLDRPEDERSVVDKDPEHPEVECCGIKERMEDKPYVVDEEPERPEDSDCCGQGCNPCVFDIYAARLAAWERLHLSAPSEHVLTPSTLRPYLSETRYRPFIVSSVEPHAISARLFTFSATGTAYLGLGAGQHLVMRGSDNLSRSYTPVSHRAGEFDLLVRIYPCGRMSTVLSALTPGNQAHFRGPYGGTGPYRRNKYRRVLMLCAGTGLAPMVSTATHIVEDELDETFLRLLYCERSVSDILLRDRLRSLAQHWNFTVRIHVPPDSEGTSRYGEDVRYARLDRAALVVELGADVDLTLVMICGTEAFNTDMTEHILALGVNRNNIHVF